MTYEVEAYSPLWYLEGVEPSRANSYDVYYTDWRDGAQCCFTTLGWDRAHAIAILRYYRPWMSTDANYVVVCTRRGYNA